MNARDALYATLDAISPHVPRLPILSDSAYAHAIVGRMAHAIVGRMAREIRDGTPVEPLDCIVISRPTPTQCALHSFRPHMELMPTTYTVRIGDMATSFDTLEAALAFADEVRT